jgi:hypothetical protein
MLASGVAAGIIAGVAFGGDWRRLATFNLKLWPVLVLAVALRLVGDFSFHDAPLALYLASILGVGIVAGWNWRVSGALLIAIGTSLNLLVVGLNSGMPYDPVVATAVGAPLPNDGLHVLLQSDTRMEFLSDVIPVGPIHSVLSLHSAASSFPSCGFNLPPKRMLLRRFVHQTSLSFGQLRL